MLYIIAADHRQIDYWCRFIAEPPIGPNDREVVRLSLSDPGVSQKLRGRMITNDDRVVTYGNFYSGDHYGWEFIDAMHMAKQKGGFTKGDERA